MMNGADPLKHRLNLWLPQRARAWGFRRCQVSKLRDDHSSKICPNRVNPRPHRDRPTPQRRARRAAPTRPPAASRTIPRSTRRSQAPARHRTRLHRAELSLDEKTQGPTRPGSDEVKGCTKCGLVRHARKTVFGEGNADAQICFIGEGPGKNEDASGRPFVGRAGQKLNDMIGGDGSETRRRLHLQHREVPRLSAGHRQGPPAVGRRDRRLHALPAAADGDHPPEGDRDAGVAVDAVPAQVEGLDDAHARQLARVAAASR